MSCIYKINIGTYTKEIESTGMKVYPSQNYFTPQQIEEEIMELIKAKEDTKELSIFTNNPYVINSFTLIGKISLLYTTYNKPKDNLVILALNKLKWYVGGYNFNYLDSELIEEGITLNKEYALFTYNNLLNNSLNDFNNKFSDLIDIESTLINSHQIPSILDGLNNNNNNNLNHSSNIGMRYKEQLDKSINKYFYPINYEYFYPINYISSKINIAHDFSIYPGMYNGIYYLSGECFYDSILKLKFNKCLLNKEVLEITLDDCYGFSTSFLYKVFTKLSNQFGKEVVLKHLKIISTQEPLLIDQIKNIINNTV